MSHLKKILKTTCATLLSVLVALAPVGMCFADYNMVVNEDNHIKHIDRIMYGVNQEWSTINHTYYLKGSSFEPNPEFVNCYKDTLGLARMAGTSSDWVKWKNNLGDISDRKANKLWGITDIVRYGMAEWLKTTRAADPNGKLTFVVNIISDSYENMADAIEYLSGDGISNPNGGVNWAKMRINSGIAEPANIFVYEIGNETDTTGGGGLSLDEYIERAKKAIAVIRSVDPDAKIAVHNYTAASTANYDFYDYRLLEELGDQIDYLSLHGYYLPDENSYTDKERGLTLHEDRVGRMQESIKRITGSDRIKIYQSEHACGRYNSDTTAGYDYVFPHTMNGTMHSGEWFLRMMWYPMLEASTYHSTDSSSWCVAFQEADGSMHMSAVGNMLQLFLRYGVGDVCESTLDGFTKTTPTNMAGQVVKSDEGLTAILVNKNDTAQTVNFTFNGKYKVKHISTIQSDDIKADNYKGTRGINVTWDAPVPEGEFNSYTCDKYSINFVTLEKTGTEEALQ